MPKFTQAGYLGQSIETGEITDLSVTAAKLAADAVTTTKILDNNVTFAKLAAVVQKGTMQEISSTTLAAPAADVTFSSISSAYDRLRLIIVGKSDAAAYQYLQLQINDDAATTYISKEFFWSGAATATANYNFAGQFRINVFENNSTNYGIHIIDIIQVAGAYRFIMANSFIPSLPRAIQHWGGWPVTDAITKIKVNVDANNMDTGTYIQLSGGYL